MNGIRFFFLWFTPSHEINFARLCSVRFTSVKADLNLKNVTVNSANGDFSARSLSDVINTDTVNHLVVQSWLDRAGILH